MILQQKDINFRGKISEETQEGGYREYLEVLFVCLFRVNDL